MERWKTKKTPTSLSSFFPSLFFSFFLPFSLPLSPSLLFSINIFGNCNEVVIVILHPYTF